MGLEPTTDLATGAPTATSCLAQFLPSDNLRDAARSVKAQFASHEDRAAIDAYTVASPCFTI
jgi:hypothetical protein